MSIPIDRDYWTEVREVQLGAAALPQSVIVAGGGARGGLVAISIANDSPVDACHIQVSGSESASFRVGVGAPWIGRLKDGSELVFSNSLSFPPSAIVANQGRVIALEDAGPPTLSIDRQSWVLTNERRSIVKVCLHFGTPPPFFPVRRAPFHWVGTSINDTGEIVFPVFGRTKISLVLAVTNGSGNTSTYSIYGVDAVDADGQPTYSDLLQSGTVDGGSPDPGIAFCYEGCPYDFVHIEISAETGAPELGIAISAYDP